MKQIAYYAGEDLTPPCTTSFQTYTMTDYKGDVVWTGGFDEWRKTNLFGTITSETDLEAYIAAHEAWQQQLDLRAEEFFEDLQVMLNLEDYPDRFKVIRTGSEKLVEFFNAHDTLFQYFRCMLETAQVLFNTVRVYDSK